MTFLLHCFLAVVALYLFGIGLTLWMIPESKRGYTLLVAPWVGYCFLTLASLIFFHSEIAVADEYAVWLAVPAALFAFLGVRRCRNGKVKLRECLWSKTNYALIASLVGILLTSVWLVSNPDQPTSMSAGNADIANYAELARYLKEFPRSSVLGFVGQCGQTTDLDIRRTLDSAYFGPPAVTAVLSSLLKCMPHQIQSLCINLFFGMSVSALFVLAHGALGFTRNLALAVALLFSLHPIMYFIVVQGFYGQIVGMGLMILLMWIQISTISSIRDMKEWVGVFPLFCLLFLGLFLSYPLILPLTCALLLLYGVVLGGLRREVRCVLYSVAFCLGSLVVCAVVPPEGRMLRLIEMSMHIRGVIGGFFVPLVWPDALIGLVGRGVFMEDVATSVHVIPTIAVLLIAFFSFVKAYRSKRNDLVAVGIIISLIYCAGLFLAFKDSTGGVIGGFQSFKLLSFHLPLFLPFICSILFLFDLLRGRGRQALVAVGCSVIILNLAYCQIVYFKRMQNGLSVGRRYNDLLAIDADMKYESVNILGSSWWDLAWKSYFLMHKKQYFETWTGLGRAQGPLLADWDLQNVGSAGVVEITNEKQKEVVVNQWFRLVRAERDRLGVTFGKGFYPIEDSGCWAGAEGKQFAIEINSPYPRALVDLELGCDPLIKANRLTIKFNGSALHEAEAGNSFQARNVEVKRGLNKLDFVSELPPERISRDDTRLATYHFKKVKITQKTDSGIQSQTQDDDSRYPYAAKWEGRFPDGWIGKEATVHIFEDPSAHPGHLHIMTLSYKWAVPIRITLAGEKVLVAALDSGHLSENIGIAELLPKRRGTIRISASSTWVLQDHLPEAKDPRALAAILDYEPGSIGLIEKKK
jgi:hypothetical protein